MKEQANSKQDLTKKDLIKILEKIDMERTNRNFKEYSLTRKGAGRMAEGDRLISEESRENIS